MTTTWFILARAVHIGACLLFFGVFAFDRFVAAAISTNDKTEIGNYWQTRTRFFNLILLPIILLSGVAWFALAAMTMSGQPLQTEILKTVWTQTQFGTVWKLRLVFWVAAAVIAMLFRFLKSKTSLQKTLIRLQLFFSGALLGSLAWAGHGLEGSRWHLFADVLHLLVAGFWPTGLLPFALLLRRLRQAPDSAHRHSIAALVRRFSALSLGSVALLAATGFINSWFLAGSFSDLLEQPYGRWLLAKIILFCFATAIGAANLLRLKPRLLVENSQAQRLEATATRLQFNVQTELAIGMAIVMIVAILGILPPPAH
ncbi:MAG TPA: CopD family protein [Candidatus Dormibacteraeota bacterium]|jgi:putative copper resistance protein D|nr:CopD family protein [Candidatus Dormibacteraeota bacterium]